MRVVVGLGGNVLLPPGQPLTHEVQRRNVAGAARSLAEVARDHGLIVTHGSGPQVGILALQDLAMPDLGNFSLDVLGAETEGMIGYLLARELRNELGGAEVAAVLTQIEVDPEDRAFDDPTKPVGPVYSEERAREIAAATGWTVAPASGGFRRVVPSPRPVRILELSTLRLLVDAGTVVVCAGGGGIPVAIDEHGRAHGVEAVIDKDRSTALVAENLEADALLLLTEVDAVYAAWGSPEARPLPRLTTDEATAMDLARGSMGPKVEAAASFAARTGRLAAIGSLEDAAAILRGEKGTRITAGAPGASGRG